SLASSVDLTGLATFTMVYWIFPFYSPVTEAGYWTTNNLNTCCTNASVTVNNTQTLTFGSDPHLPGHWQMITISRTLGAITLWRDQVQIATVQAAGTPVSAVDFAPAFSIGRTVNATGVNAMWADFRIYNRKWTQTDVNYAY